MRDEVTMTALVIDSLSDHLRKSIDISSSRWTFDLKAWFVPKAETNDAKLQASKTNPNKPRSSTVIERAVKIPEKKLAMTAKTLHEMALEGDSSGSGTIGIFIRLPS